jgi:hypothetical protein
MRCSGRVADWGEQHVVQRAWVAGVDRVPNMAGGRGRGHHGLSLPVHQYAQGVALCSLFLFLFPTPSVEVSLIGCGGTEVSLSIVVGEIEVKIVIVCCLLLVAGTDSRCVYCAALSSVFLFRNHVLF